MKSQIRLFRGRAGKKRRLTFHDLRRTALTEMGNTGASDTEIVSISGHAKDSRVIGIYVKPDRESALNAASKRQNKGRNSESRKLENAMIKNETYQMDMAGVTGLEPATSGVTGQRSNQLSYTPLRRTLSRSKCAAGHVLEEGLMYGKAPSCVNA